MSCDLILDGKEVFKDVINRGFAYSRSFIWQKAVLDVNGEPTIDPVTGKIIYQPVNLTGYGVSAVFKQFLNGEPVGPILLTANLANGKTTNGGANGKYGFALTDADTALFAVDQVHTALILTQPSLGALPPRFYNVFDVV